MTQVHTMTRPLARERAAGGVRQNLRDVLGETGWQRLPAAVRERFAEHATATTYAGAFEIVRASSVGRVFAWAGRLFGMPVAPRVGVNVEAQVRVRPRADGVVWERVYRWNDGASHVVSSTKVVTADGLVERLPARLCMPLDVFERNRVLNFVSRGYYFDLTVPGFGFKAWLPRLLCPGITHVEHIDLGNGWFRFTMTVTHPLLGEMFFQTGRFCAAED